ncbi:MAG: hypothetical protein K5930_05230 [Treponemataceae bacterium]|nr:hypothetical protein [Treponemataceae bacterium]
MDFMRAFTKGESVQWQNFGEVEKLFIIAPLFSWSENPSKEGDCNQVVMTPVYENAIIQLAMDVAVGLKEGFVVSIMNKSGSGHDLFFSPEEFDKAVNTFNSVVLALEKTNYL